MTEGGKCLVFAYGDDTRELRIYQFRICGREYIQLSMFGREGPHEEFRHTPSTSDRITLEAKWLSAITEGVRPNRPLTLRGRFAGRLGFDTRERCFLFNDVSDVAHLVRGWG